MPNINPVGDAPSSTTLEGKNGVRREARTTFANGRSLKPPASSPSNSGLRERPLAKVVAAYGLPHTPFFPSKVVVDTLPPPTGLMFGKARASLEAARPDAIILFDTDHYNTFFFDNFPIFAIGIDEKFRGPILRAARRHAGL